MEQSFFYRPMKSIQSIPKCHSRHATPGYPILQEKSFSIECITYIVSAISRLFFFSCPSAIFRFIITVIFRIPVKTVLFRRRISHVGVKFLKGLPSLADFYSTSSIFWMRFASLNHAAPCSIDLRSAFPMIIRVYSYATTRFSNFQMTLCSFYDISATTSQNPTSTFTIRFSLSSDSQETKC